MSRVRTVFLGTPQFAVIALKSLLLDEHFEIVGVVTQPDRSSGRKLLLTPSPVKTVAIENDLRVISPDKINQELILEEIKKWGAEVAVVVAYGQILPQKFLDLFPFGAVNVHGSLLPKWRGAAPIQRSVQAGETETGVALQKIVKELDAGDVFGVRKVEVPLEMTALELHDKLAVLGADLLRVELMDYVRGNLTPIPQDVSQVTYAKKITKAECEINWHETAMEIHNKARAFLMGPGTFTTYIGESGGSKKLKIHRTEIANPTAVGDAGQIVRADVGTLEVQTGKGILKLLEVQPESRTKMSAAEFLKGNTLTSGERFGPTN